MNGNTLWGHLWEQYTLGKTKQLNLGLGGGGGHKGYLRNYYVGLAYQGKDTMFRFIIEYI
jgi:hypothetical protein